MENKNKAHQLSKVVLNEKYKHFIRDTESFREDVRALNDIIDFNTIDISKPLLIYIKARRDPLYYLIGVQYSLRSKRVLDYVAISGSTFNREHFATEKERDQTLYDKMFNGELLYIILSDNEIGNEYMITQLLDLIDYRERSKRKTVITFETTGSNNYVGKTKVISDHFIANGYGTLNTSNGITTQHSATSVKTSTRKTVKGRII